MQYPQTLDELERVMRSEFRFDRMHDYDVKDGVVSWLGILRSVISRLQERIGDKWTVVERRCTPHDDDDFCRVDIIPKVPSQQKEG